MIANLGRLRIVQCSPLRIRSISYRVVRYRVTQVGRLVVDRGLRALRYRSLQPSVRLILGLIEAHLALELSRFHLIVVL